MRRPLESAAAWTATYEQLGVTLDVQGLQDQAMAMGHRPSVVANAQDWLRALSGGAALLPAHRAVSQALDRYAASLAALLDRVPVEGTIHVSTAGIMVEAAAAGARLDQDDLRRQVLDPGVDGRLVMASVHVLEPQISQAEVTRALALAHSATRPLSLVLDGQNLVIPIERVRALVHVAAVDGRLELRWPDTTMNLIVMMAMERFDRPALGADPGLVVDTDGLRALIAESVGWPAAERVVTVPVWRIAPAD